VTQDLQDGLYGLGIPKLARRAETAAIRVLALAGIRGVSHAANMAEAKSSPSSRHRRSASADAALRAELERIGKMTIEERVKAALSMQNRFAWLVPTGKPR
jgi:hypothetical protein